MQRDNKVITILSNRMEEAKDEESSGTEARTLATSLARSMAIRYSILLPKMKAANFFQPEDHVSSNRIRSDWFHTTRFGRWAVGGLHMGSIFCGGTVLFVLQEKTCRWLEPSHGDFGSATTAVSALAGACGGAGYGLWATVTAAWLGTGVGSLPQLGKKLLFLRRALPYTLARDMGGFALYFGVYSAAHRRLSRDLAEPIKEPCASAIAAHTTASAMPNSSPTSTATSSMPTPIPPAVCVSQGAASENAAPTAGARHAGTPDAATLRTMAATMVSGGLSGLCTYLWRSPWDTLYKRSIGWRGDSAPLWSLQRFVSSPRGAKAVAIGAGTWSAYEFVDAGLRRLGSTSSEGIEATATPRDAADGGGATRHATTTPPPSIGPPTSAAARYMAGPEHGAVCEVDRY